MFVLVVVDVFEKVNVPGFGPVPQLTNDPPRVATGTGRVLTVTDAASEHPKELVTVTV